MLTLIAAVGKNFEIGLENKLLWNIPEDLARFKMLTTNKTIIMGRKTFESIGRALPNRKNIVLTRDTNYTAAGIQIAHSLEEALFYTIGEDEVFVIGGAEVYKQAMSFADKMELTYVNGEFTADTFFPRFNMDEWRIVNTQAGGGKERNVDFYTFLTFERL